MLASERYKEKIATYQSLKWKLKCDKLENSKTKNKDLEVNVNHLRKKFGKKSLKAHKNQDLSAISKAAAFLWTAKEIGKTLAELSKAEEYIGKYLK